MSNSDLKIIAIATMLIDHIGAVLFPQVIVLRIIGRLAFPIFAFLLVEGCYHTSKPKAYLLRLGLFALLSEIPFDLAFYGKTFEWGHQNIFFTLFLGATGILVINFFEKKYPGHLNVLFVGVLIVVGVLSVVIRSDYDIIGIVVIFLFYGYRKEPRRALWSVGTFFLLYGFMATGFSIRNTRLAIVAAAALAMPLLYFYNGERGIKLKYVFYLFYPFHLIVLYGIDQLILMNG